jgi:ABC-type iron transport system FetAB permease component
MPSCRIGRDADGESYLEARQRSYDTELIPVVHPVFAAGMVARPGMMDGKILSRVTP